MNRTKLSSLELRKKFFDYFIKLGHEKVASSSLIPAQDPTILFTNAGMNQFKDVFLGNEKRSYKRAVSIQKCVRAGGKHNDLENVGFTQRHLTFFEMMGNFSFGDYFKKEAIRYAWDFLTKEVGLDAEKLFVSVHLTDQESYDIWHKEMHIPKEKIFKLGESNFWQMGDVGPCGPCTEIFVDRGSLYGCGRKECDLACGCDRFLEVWNNVFMQFNRQADGTDVLLKQTGVDTGMGLERLTLIVQNKDSVFETDLFNAIFKKIETLTGHVYEKSNSDIQAAFNVIGDHVRSATFLIADGCAPSNDGRGYVLRKIIRRAALFAQRLTDKNIFPQISASLIDDMKSVYPELISAKERIAEVLKSEIERFAENLVRGKRILQEYMQKNSNKKVIDGAHAFMLYDTYGFPLEVTKLIALEFGCTVDEASFEKHMEEQRLRSGKKMKEQATIALDFLQSIQTEFAGYNSLYEESKIVAIIIDDQSAKVANQGEICWIAVEKTPLYVACGGQVNDTAIVTIHDKTVPVLDLKKIGNTILMQIQVPVKVALDDMVSIQVDEFIRLQTMKNHTATHLLQAALQKLFGNSVKQAGSIVTPDYLRFDFTHHKPLNISEIQSIENMVNQKIWDNIPVVIKNTTFKQAVADGVIAFFGDKYNPENVRAVAIADFSAELCGGTHVRATGDIGAFKIVEETALAAGQRRIVAITGAKAIEEFQQDFSIVKTLSQDFKVKPNGLIVAVQELQETLKRAEKEVKALKTASLVSLIPQLATKIEMIKLVPFLCAKLPSVDLDVLREAMMMFQKQKPGLYVLTSTNGEKTVFVAGLDKSLVNIVLLQDLKLWLQETFAWQGGGSNTLIQGSGKIIDHEKLNEGIKSWLQLKK